MATRIEKALRHLLPSGSSRGTLSSYVLNAPPQFGQPIPQQTDAAALITPLRKRELALRTPTVAAAVNAILDYATQVPIKVRNVDVSKPANDDDVRRVLGFLTTPNPQDHSRRFKEKLLRDLTVLGWAGVEIEPTKQQTPANLWPLDGARLKVDYDEHGIVQGYDMIDAHGTPIYGPDQVHAWLPDQVLWFERDSVTNSVYPVSRLDMLFSAGLLEDLMMNFIGLRFTDSNVPYGVMTLGDVSTEEVKKAVQIWNNQAKAQHKILLSAAKGDSKFTRFDYTLKDLEAPALLALIRSAIMGVLGVTENEIGQSQSQSNSSGYNLSYTFKKRAIEPLLDEFCQVLTYQFVWKQLGLTSLELYYEEIDSRDEMVQSQIDDTNQRRGVWSLNDIRNRQGKDNVPGGEVPMMFTGSAWVPVSMMEDFARAQMEAVQNEADLLAVQVKMARLQLKQAATAPAGTPGSGAEGQAGISEPLVRGPQPPEKFTTPGGSGSSTPKIKYPKPQVPNAANTAGASNRPRGVVETARRVGSRKEEQQ